MVALDLGLPRLILRYLSLSDVVTIVTLLNCRLAGYAKCKHKKSVVIHSHFPWAIVCLSHTAGWDLANPCTCLTSHVKVCPVDFIDQSRKGPRNAELAFPPEISCYWKFCQRLSETPENIRVTQNNVQFFCITCHALAVRFYYKLQFLTLGRRRRFSPWLIKWVGTVMTFTWWWMG